MIPPEQRAEIRRLFYAEHWRVGTIASHLGVHHATVQQAIEHDRFVRPGSPIRPSLLDPYKAFIIATLEQYPRLRATRLYWMLRDRGFTGSAVQLRRYVRTVRPTPLAEVYLRLDTLRGEQAQADWAHFGTLQIGRARRALSCFVLVLSWSRAVYARFALDQTLESRSGLSDTANLPTSLTPRNFKYLWVDLGIKNLRRCFMDLPSFIYAYMSHFGQKVSILQTMRVTCHA